MRSMLDKEWQRFYNIVKDSSWPDCITFNDFHLLPTSIQKELVENFGLDTSTLVFDEQSVFAYKKFLCNGTTPITVFYTNELDGGGTSFGQDYIAVIKKHYPNRKFAKVFEWCSGPGFIGFSLLSHGICNSLCFTDLYNPALEAIDATVQHKNNNCAQSVSSYLMKDLSLLPNHEIFDMVVANPPHFNTPISPEKNTNRLCVDIHWQAHANFFKNIKSHLHKNSVILLQENSQGSTVADFSKMILEAGLEITDTFDSQIYPIYYIEIKIKKL